MAKPLRRLLRHFGDFWNVDGPNQAPAEIDISAPIQPVFDVGPMAEREAGRLAIPSGIAGVGTRPGLWRWSVSQSHSGAGTLSDGLQLSAGNLKQYGLDLTRFDLELYACTVRAARTPACDAVWLGFTDSAQSPGIRVSDAWVTAQYFTTFMDLGSSINASAGVPTMPISPIRVRENFTIYAVSHATGISIVVPGFLFKIVPK